jgi:predicted ATPase/DNA-binding CsgD family transcriptional regulator
VSRPADVPRGPIRDARVTARELDVLRLVGERLSNREIADLLFLSERTVESHVSSLLRKLGGTNRSALVAVAAQVRDRSAPGSALPRPLTSFVGREGDLDDLLRLLPGHRLVTLTGPAGAGKTRVALQVARAAETLPVPVLVDLTTVPPGGPVPEAFAGALGVGAGAGVLQRLLDDLADGRHWLVVDNCEHVAAAVADLLAAVLAATDDVRVLATSREPLHVPGEVVYELPPLPLPPETDDPAEVLVSPAGRLFADRGAAALPGFRVTADEARSVAGLCRRLDGLPLAIELAAARLRAFSPAELLTRLDDRLALLTGGSAAAGGRHRTLEAALRWSYDLLDDGERQLLERCSVFPGDFDYDTLVGAVSLPPLLAPDIARLFPRLLDRSLVSARREGSTTAYRLLDSIRQFAADRLRERGTPAAVRAQHARYHLQAGAVLGPALRGADQRRALQWLDRRWEDLRVAVRWSLDTPDDAAAWAYVAGVGTGWEVAGARGDLFGWLDELLSRPFPPGIPPAPCWSAAAIVLCYQDTSRAVEIARRAVAAASSADRSLAELALGWALALDADPAAAVHLRAAAAAFEAAGDSWHVALALEALGDGEPDLETALDVVGRGAELFGTLGDDVKRANCLSQMALRCIDAGVRPDEARERLVEARELADRSANRHEQLHAELFGARLDQLWGNPEGGGPAFARLLPEFRRIGDRRCTGRCLLGLGQAAVRAGDIRGGRGHVLESIVIAQETGEPLDVVRGLRLLAECRTAEGDAAAAERLLAAAERAAAEPGSVRPPDARLAGVLADEARLAGGTRR